MSKKIYAFAAILVFRVVLTLPADDIAPPSPAAPAPASPAAESASPAASAPAPAEPASPAASSQTGSLTTKPVKDSQLDTIRYGTETEIASLIQTLKADDSDYLNDELIQLVQNTKNKNILTGVFKFFADQNKKGLENRALLAIEDRDQESFDTVNAAVDYLGRVNDAAAAEPLEKLIDSGEKRYINPAIRALGRATRLTDAADGAAEYLIDYYENREPAQEDEREIVVAVGETGSEKGVLFLTGIAGDEDNRAALRMAAMEALSRIGKEDSGKADAGLPAILAAVSSNDPNVRAAAVSALGPFSGAETEKAILEAFRDSFWRTRLAAVKAARDRKLESAAPYLRFRAEHDEVPQIKDEAVRTLGEIGGADNLDFINGLFENRKNSDRVRIVAAEMLIKNAPDTYVDKLVVETGEAKSKNQKPLYNGFLKILGGAKSPKLEAFARSLLKGDIIEKSFGLDIAVNNGFTSLGDDIRLLTEPKNGNASLARKAALTLEKLGLK